MVSLEDIRMFQSPFNKFCAISVVFCARQTAVNAGIFSITERWLNDGLERTMVWTRTHESLDIYCFGLGWSGHICLRTHEERTKNFERTIVWTYPLSVWDDLDIGTLSLGRSGHRHFLSGPVWTYPLWVWDLSLGLILKH